MGWLCNKTLEGRGFFTGFTDHHCHLLPGVDDGVRTMDGALEALNVCQRLGFRRVWLTPHVMEDVANPTALLRERFEELCEAWRGRGGECELRLAAEYMLDNLFEERLAAGDLLPLDDNLLLVETSCLTPPVGLAETFGRIRTRGFHPLLAHPERYAYAGPEDFKSWTEAGVRLQINLGSAAGFYGPEARAKAVWLMRHGLYHCTGTDSHRGGWLESLARARINKKIISQL